MTDTKLREAARRMLNVLDGGWAGDIPRSAFFGEDEDLRDALRAALDEPPEAPVDRERVFDLEHAISQHLDATGECKGDGDDPSLWLCRSPECTYCELARALDPDKCGTPLAPRPSTCACGHPASDHGLDMSFNEPCRRCECCDYGDATEPPEQAPEPTEGDRETVRWILRRLNVPVGSADECDIDDIARALATARAQGYAAGVEVGRKGGSE